ncbi:TPA: 50S ribosomal protein L30 [Candidatus Micrarchaeota archaeon]|nr:50S ribosomal protein L30 [Candidatus Micrarchaeota archaeon]
MAKLALIRVRGTRGLKPKIAKTLELLRLTRPNHCVVVDDSKEMKGMINVVKDYIAFGPVDEDAIALLLTKRGSRGSKALKAVAKEDEIKAAAKEMAAGKKPAKGFVDPVFRLKPPRKGYKSVKLPYPEGDLGARKDILPLLRRMV